ncbi:hypothetical protein Hte_003970 [Hypoxylon texense]
MDAPQTPAKDSAPAFIPHTPTAGDQKFAETLFKHLPKSLDVDWDAFAKDMGLKSAAIAKVRRKYFADPAGGNSGSPSKPSGVKKAVKETKPKSKRVSKSSPKKVAKGKDGSDDQDEDTKRNLQTLKDFFEEDEKGEKDIKADPDLAVGNGE